MRSSCLCCLQMEKQSLINRHFLDISWQIRKVDTGNKFINQCQQKAIILSTTLKQNTNGISVICTVQNEFTSNLQIKKRNAYYFSLTFAFQWEPCNPLGSLVSIYVLTEASGMFLVTFSVHKSWFPIASYKPIADIIGHIRLWTSPL